MKRSVGPKPTSSVSHHGVPSGALAVTTTSLLPQQAVEVVRVRELRDLRREVGRADGFRAGRGVRDGVLERALDLVSTGGDGGDVAGAHLGDEVGAVGNRHARLRCAEEGCRERVVEDEQGEEQQERAPADAAALRRAVFRARPSDLGASLRGPCRLKCSWRKPPPRRCHASAARGIPAATQFAAGLHGRRRCVRDSCSGGNEARAGATGDPCSRPVRGARGREAGGRGRREAPGPAGDARPPARTGRGGRCPHRRRLGGGAAVGSAERAASSRRPAPRGARRETPSSARPTATPSRTASIDAVDFEELLADTRAALRDGDVSAAADSVAAATALWRGPALQGLTGTAWFDAEARRLESLHVDALEEQFEVALALGEHRELVPALRSALADNPFRERLWGQLMLALYRSGRQADALEIFQEARRVLSDELGLEPGPELRRLQEAILAQDAAIAAFPAGRRRRGNLPAPATLVRRPRRRARPGRGPAARAPSRDAHRPAGRGQEPARGRGRARSARGGVRRRDLGRRLRAGGRRGGRRRPSPGRRPRGSRHRPARGRRLPPSPRRRARRPRRVRARPRGGGADRVDAARGVGPACGSWRRAARHFTSPARRGFRSHRSSSGSRQRRGVAGRGALPRACACGPARASRRTARLSRSPPRSPVASTGFRSRSSSPPHASTCSGSRSSSRSSSAGRRSCATPRHPIRPGPRCRGSSTGATTSCTATRRRCCISSPSTAAAPRATRSSRSRRRTASTRRPSTISSRRWSTSRS